MAETLLLADKIISSAELLAIHTTPIEIIAGVGGQVIIVHKVIQEYTYGTTPYLEQFDLDMGMRYAGGMTVMRDYVLCCEGSGHGSGIHVGEHQYGSMDKEILTNLSGLALEYYSMQPLSGGDGTLRVLVYYTMLTL